MGDDAQLRTWVSEKLLSILGYSQPAVVTFIIEIAKKSASPTSVVQKLIENGFSSSSETHVFAEEIYSKVPHQAAGLNVRFDFMMLCLPTRSEGNELPPHFLFSAPVSHALRAPLTLCSPLILHWTVWMDFAVLSQLK
ncbi:hypothetical protein EJ110_NYTH30638 [Nymphaea thermarum]|nr:hypothetical protein EJ110_NYTH30638 [Nymphaea thermarum]